jgi:hypothetical protein
VLGELKMAVEKRPFGRRGGVGHRKSPMRRAARKA